MTADTGRMRLRVTRICDEAENIRSFELRHPDGAALPTFEAGAHLIVDAAPDLLRQYSLCNDPAEADRYVIAVQREKAANDRIALCCSRALSDRLVLDL